MAILAHGGAAGAALEIGFIVLPILIFAVLAVLSKRRAAREEAEEKREP